MSDTNEAKSLHLSAKPIAVGDNVTLQTPLSRRGAGPGLLVLLPEDYRDQSTSSSTKTLDPEPQQKWAEEGFAVVQVKVKDAIVAKQRCDIGIRAFKQLPECAAFSHIGVIVYDLGMEEKDAQRIELWQHLINAPEIAAITVFTSHPVDAQVTSPTPKHLPLMIHTTNKFDSPQSGLNTYVYDFVPSLNFTLPGHKDYKAGPASVSHTRTLQFLKKHLNGPYFDLEAIWDEHCFYEFGERAVEKTMGTMVQEPYVNHVPTMTGGIGRAALTAFYRDHFIFNNPDDTKLELISRTVGVDRVIDEFIFCFTHNKIIDWLVPGIPPTHRAVRIPFTSVVNIRGDRLYHEHIAWDQASVLRQLGLLPEYLPYPYPLPDGRTPGPGKRFEYRVPAAGADTARKMVDETSLESNEMLGFEIREVDI